MRHVAQVQCGKKPKGKMRQVHSSNIPGVCDLACRALLGLVNSILEWVPW